MHAFDQSDGRFRLFIGAEWRKRPGRSSGATDFALRARTAQAPFTNACLPTTPFAAGGIAPRQRFAHALRQLLVMLGVYLFAVGSFNHVQTSSGVQVQGHPGEQFPWGYCEVTFAHSS